MSEDDYLQRTKFVSALGLSLHHCGASSHRIERHLGNLCQLLGVQGSFLYTPTSFTFCYWLHDPMDQTIQIERVQPTDGDLGRLELIDSLVDRFEGDELSFEEMRAEFDLVLAVPKYYSRWVEGAAWVVLSTSFAALLSNNGADALVSGLITMVIFLLAQVAARSTRMANTLEIVAALISGVIATAVASLGVTINTPFVILSTIVVFIPGLSLTVALSEIAERDLVSGTSKFVHSVMGLFKLYFGALLGVGLGSLLWGGGVGDTVPDVNNLPEWKTLPSILLLAGSLTVAFNIKLRHSPWCLLSAVIGFYVAQIGEAYFGVAAGMFLGAFAVGVYSNFFSNLSKIPASLVLTQGLILLVPGSKTYIMLNSWITGEQMLASGSNGNQAFVIFISLVVGLLFANAVLPARKSL